MTYPQQPQPGYYPQQPGYPPVPQAQFQAPPPGYPQQYPPQGFGPPAGYPAPAPQPQAPVLARGTLEDYLDQPTGGGGASVTKYFTDQRPQGSWLQLQVTRDLVNSDVRQQTDNNDQPATYKNGKPKFVLIVPVRVLASSDGQHAGVFEDGSATVWLKGIPSDSFKGAMSQAGISNPDKALAHGKIGGAVFTMVSAGQKAPHKAGFAGAKLFNFQYTPGGREESAEAALALDPTLQTPSPAVLTPGIAPAPAPQFGQAPGPVPAAAPAAPPAPPAPPAAPMAVPAPVAPIAAGSPPLAPAAPQYHVDPATGARWDGQQWLPPEVQAAPAAPPAPPAPPQAPPPPPGTPADAEKAALLARLQGQG